MGVGIVSRFRYGTDVNVSDLQTEIMRQINKYLPMFSRINISVSIDNDQKAIKIYLTSNEVNTIIPIDITTGKVLSDMLK